MSRRSDSGRRLWPARDMTRAGVWRSSSSETSRDWIAGPRPRGMSNFSTLSGNPRARRDASHAPQMLTTLGVPDGLGLQEGLDPGQLRGARPVRLDGVDVVAGRAQDALEVVGARTLELCPNQAVGVGGTGPVDGVDVLVGGQPGRDLPGASGDQVDDTRWHIG